jgi:hypothetical protein
MLPARVFERNEDNRCGCVMSVVGERNAQCQEEDGHAELGLIGLWV